MRTSDELDVGPLAAATSPGEFDAALEKLTEPWAKLWNDIVSDVIANHQDQAVEALKLSDRLQGVEELKPRLWSLERRARSLMRCIDLAYMQEERSFMDYRLMIEQRVDAVSDEAAGLNKNIQHAIDEIDRLIAAVEKSPVHRERLSAELVARLHKLRRVLESARQRVNQLHELVRQQSFKALLADALRTHWEDISEAFGTWQRRLRPAFEAFINLFIVGLLAYLVLGSLVPTTLWITAFAIGAAVVALRRYYQTRSRLETRLKAVARGLVYIDPSAAEESPDEQENVSRLTRRNQAPPPATFWRENNETKDEQVKLFDKVSVDLRTAHAKSLDHPKPTPPVLYALAGIGTALALILISWLSLASSDTRLWPRYAITEEGSYGRGCASAYGWIVWAGPGHVVVKPAKLAHGSGDGVGLTFIPHERIIRMQRREQAPDPCPTVPPATAGDNTLSMVTAINSEPIVRNAIMVPFFPGEVRGCKEAEIEAAQGARPTPAGEVLLTELRAKFATCASGRRPEIDVLGFASSKQFACNDPTLSARLNHKLAEVRRTRVLEALDRNLASDGNTFSSNNFTLKPPGIRRWSSERHMLESAIYSSDDASISRYAMIQVLDPGSCFSIESQQDNVRDGARSSVTEKTS